MRSVTKIVVFVKEFKELITLITKLLATLATVLGLATSLYISYQNSKSIEKNKEKSQEELKVKDAQIEVLQSMSKQQYE